MPRGLTYLIYLIILFLVFKPDMTCAQDEPPRLTLRDAVEQTLQLNPELNRMLARVEAKRTEWKTATGLYSPEFSYVREGISSVGPIPFSEQRFAIQQEFDFPLTTLYRIRRISAEREAIENELEALKKEITSNVKSKYVEVLYGIFIRELRANSYRLSKELYDAVLIRVESGVGTYIDQLSAEIRLVLSENDQYEAERLYHEARYKLFSYIGMDPDEQRYDIIFADTLFTHDELIEQEIALYSLEKQPLYISARALVQAGDYNLREAKSGFLPGFRIGYLSQDFGTGYHFQGVEAGLRIPLWGMFEQSGQVQKARSNLNSTRWDQKAVELKIKEKIELSWHGYDNSQITIDLYKSQLKGKSEKLLALTTEAYRLGQIDLLKLIEAQQMYLDSQEKYLDALRDYYLRLIELEQYVPYELVY